MTLYRDQGVVLRTWKLGEADRIIGLEIGANDYVVKPFFVRELIARIRLQFRTQSSPARTLQAGGLELDRNSRRLLASRLRQASGTKRVFGCQAAASRLTTGSLKKCRPGRRAAADPRTKTPRSPT